MVADAGQRTVLRNRRQPPRQQLRSRRLGARGTPAFTLLEILLALALVGLMAGALISGSMRLISTRAQSPQDVFWEASRAARRAALTSQTESALSFDAKEKAFVLTGTSGERRFAVPDAPRDLAVDFLHAQTTSGLVLIGGQLVDTATLPSVTFFEDGTCTPFRVQFRSDGPATVIAIDPWTCAAVLAEGEK